MKMDERKGPNAVAPTPSSAVKATSSDPADSATPVAPPSTPTRSRSADIAAVEAAEPRLNKALFLSSDEDEEDEEDEEQDHRRGAGRRYSHESNSSSRSVETHAFGGAFRHQTRRMDRLNMYVKQDPPYHRHLPHSPARSQTRRSSSVEQVSPSSSERRSPASSTRSASSPCASPSKLLSSSLGVTLSMLSPAPSTLTPGRQHLRTRQVLQKLRVEDCANPFVSSFEDLEIIQWLGAGVSAEAFKVRDPKSGATFAVKKSKQELRSDRERNLLMQEIAVLEKLTASQRNFNNIVRYYQAWQENGFFFLQMELCGGGTLKDFLVVRNRETLPEIYLWTILRDVASGLKVLHDHEIVHLDLKPDNIFITKCGRLKLGDFGMAGKVVTALQSSGRTGDLEGDAKYMAKELLSSAERLPSADIFCLGITLLEIATGVALPSAGDQWHQLRQGDLPLLPSEYSKELETLIRQMMHPDPTRRPTAATILASPRIQNSIQPAVLILEYAHTQQQIVPTKVRDTSRSARNSIQTPHKTRFSLP